MTENSSNPRSNLQFTPRLIFGLGLLIVGSLWLLDNLGVIDADGFWDFWPLIFVAVGLSKLTEVQRTGSWLSSFAWIAVGLWWTAYNLEWINIHVFDLWPVIFIIGGIVIVRRALMPNSYSSSNRSRVKVHVATAGRVSDDTAREVAGAVKEAAGEIRRGVEEATDEIRRGLGREPRSKVGGVAGGTSDRDESNTGWAVCCGIRRRIDDQAFRGGDFTAFMGGVEVDLTHADMVDGEAILEVLAFWGGIDITVPREWRVVPQVTPILGGFVDETEPLDPNSDKRLIVRGLAMMGGVHVRN